MCGRRNIPWRQQGCKTCQPPKAANRDLSPCCDMHNEHCEPPSELCCAECAEWHHGLHACAGRLGTSHDDGSRCVLEAL